MEREGEVVDVLYWRDEERHIGMVLSFVWRFGMEGGWGLSEGGR